MLKFFLILGFLSGTGALWASTDLQLVDEKPHLLLADARDSSLSKDLSADDLGFTQADLQSDLSQKDLDTREDMLRIHQIFGLTTEAALLATFVAGIATENNIESGNTTDTNLVSDLGFLTLGLYLTTASFEMFAPKPKNKKKTGNTAIHEALSWIHLPLMIIVPLTGDMMNDRIANHQSLGNLPVVHGILATTLLLTYTASLTVITF